MRNKIKKVFYDDLPKNRKYSYAELLNCLDWEIKRHEILNRDGRKCTKCSSVSDLDVHHVNYTNGLLPWLYPNEGLITLCKNCHKDEHKDKVIFKRVPSVTKTWFVDYSHKQIKRNLP